MKVNWVGYMVLVAATLGSSALAQSIPSAKVNASIGNVNIVNAKDLSYRTVSSALIKGSSPADLLIDINLVCGLMTSTTVRTKDGVSDTSSASAAVYGRVLVDGQVAAPGEIPLCKRSQTLSATLQGIIDSCRDSNGDGVISMASECSTSLEEISLMLDTTSAHGFTWAKENIGSGVHRVELQVKVESHGSAQNGAFNGYASVGMASLVVNKANLKNQAEIQY